jgi:hypothetical protein
MSSLLPDEPIDNATRFGFDDYSKALATIIKSKELQTPFTIAVHGDWGSGKTSLMKTVSRELESVSEEEVKVKTIWFEAWEFEKLPIPLWKIFLNRITMELQEMVVDSGLKAKIKAAGEGLLLLSSDILLKRFVGISLEEIGSIKEKIWDDIKRIDSLREELSQCIEDALKNDPSHTERLVIFIDDLDRCLPEQCVEVFESIKLFLNSKRCVFVVGVNKEQICKAFEVKFGEKGPSGLHYMEKFVQLHFDLPRKNPIDVQSFLMEYASEQLRRSPKTIELISRFIEPNPRKVKRWLNSVIFLEELFRVRQQKQVVISVIDVSLVSIWLFIKSFFPDFAIMVENDPSLLNAAIRVVGGSGSEEDKRKIGDYAMDQRLTEFLSTLESDYDENQLKEIVYLSRLTPVEQISILPSQILSRIVKMPIEELSDQLARLTDYGVSMLAERIIDSLSAVKNYQEYQENLEMFELLDRLIRQVKEDSKKVLLFEKIVDFTDGSAYASKYFFPRLQTYTSWYAVKSRILEKGYLDRIIASFAGSNSFESAKHNSAVLCNFLDNLTSGHIRIIVKASIENDQIYYSFGARRNLKSLFIMNKKVITPEEKAKIKELMFIDIPD